jgi:hypothetical protein
VVLVAVETVEVLLLEVPVRRDRDLLVVLVVVVG